MRILQKLSISRKNLSFLSWLFFILAFPYRRIRRLYIHRKIKNTESLADRFTLIYRRNAWGSKESLSGSGSTLAMTQSVRTSLNLLINEFKIKTILDIPCGDFNWMKEINFQEVKYIGGDIVEPLIQKLRENYTSENVSFIHIDITKDPLPECDLVLNRDCLFHFSYEDILATLNNFVLSKSKFLLTTSHDNYGIFVNADIQSGDFRPIDLFTAPFHFPKDSYFEIPELGEGSLPSRKLYLWDRDQVKVAKSNLESSLSGS